MGTVDSQAESVVLEKENNRASSTVLEPFSSQSDQHSCPTSPHSKVASTAASPLLPRNVPSSQRIGPYVLGKTLGVGSTGRVKLGIHIETNHRVAIKIISKESLDPNIKEIKKGDMNRKLEREITIMKLIKHPNVLQLFDVYETAKELFLVLEHVEGGELFDYLVKKGRLSNSEAVGFFQQIIMGVEYCHRHLICHRDLKPENLLLDKDRNVKVADFGMASMQVPSKMLETSCGSPHYASPEIIKGMRYDGASSDIWSCGVILYALVTGNLPFDDENIRRLLNKVKTGMYFIPEHVDADARDLIKRMLVISPEKRITMKEVMQHRWFLSRPVKNDKYYPSPMEAISLSSPLGQQIETDIIESLSLLGWTDKDSLCASLRSETVTPEKVYYNLLRARKWEMFEHYDAGKLALYDVEGGPRRRTDSYSSALSNDQKSIDDDSDRKEEKRVNFKSAETTIEGAPSNSVKFAAATCSPSTYCASNGSPRVVSESGCRASRVLTANVRITSPLAVSTLPISDAEAKDVPQDMNSSNDVPTTPDSKLAEPQILAPPGRRRAHSTAVSASSNNRKLLTISIPDSQDMNSACTTKTSGNGPISPSVIEGPRSAAMVNAFTAIGLGTPKFHRKMFDAPQTPVISQTPKQSWFTNLFNFKPESFTLLSNKSMDATSTEVITILTSLDVKFQLRRDGLIKCKYDPATSQGVPTSLLQPIAPEKENETGVSTQNLSVNSGSVTTGGQPNSPVSGRKAVKFKIEILADTAEMGHGALRVHLTQQQGAFSTFQSVVEAIRTKWNLNQ
ncbi:hypothetical protein BASA81_015250 [Batrachochytrium salamandrivorans]|nr:hypothetical protein BASA81_015250 [Batrachochytrium salamandrivorans]